MSIITFINNRKEETGKSLSMAAIATYMSIEHNLKTLIVSTTNQEDPIKRCFWTKNKKTPKFGLFGANRVSAMEEESGIAGLDKMRRSNKITPQNIANYTKVVFKERLEVLLGSENEHEDFSETYPDILTMANQAYDMVLIDLDDNIHPEVRKQILEKSDLVLINLSQRLISIDQYKEEKQRQPLYQSPKTLILFGRYDRYSKYNSKNISRYLEEKNQVLTIPYSTLYFEAAEEGTIADIFLKFRKSIDPEDRNAFFIQEIKRTVENIIYRLQVLQAKM